LRSSSTSEAEGKPPDGRRLGGGKKPGGGAPPGGGGPPPASPGGVFFFSSCLPGVEERLWGEFQGCWACRAVTTTRKDSLIRSSPIVFGAGASTAAVAARMPGARLNPHPPGPREMNASSSSVAGGSRSWAAATSVAAGLPLRTPFVALGGEPVDRPPSSTCSSSCLVRATEVTGC